MHLSLTHSDLKSAKTDLVDLLIPAVVPGSRVPLAVLVGHDRSERVVHGLGGEVLRGDQDQAIPLTNLLDKGQSGFRGC